MSLSTENTLTATSLVYLWFKVKGSMPLMLSDVPKLIKFKWTYFKDNWEKVKQDYIKLLESYEDPYSLKKNIDDFSDYINSHRAATNNPFLDGNTLYRFFYIFDVTDINKTLLTKEEEDIVSAAIKEVNGFVRKDFIELRKKIATERDIIADRIGLSDDTYNSIYDRSSTMQQIKPNNRDINKTFLYQKSIKSIDYILANIYKLDTVAIDPYAVARTNANNPDLFIGSYSAGILRRFNYGETLQDIAERELGSRDRWMDLAIANGLKPPYIDEIGSKIPLLSNANGNQINIAATTSNTLNADRLYINQVVLLKSDALPFAEQRVITNIKEAPVSGELIIELDGDFDLSKYRIDDNAYIRVFKPSTINSSFLIMIPTNDIIADIQKGDTPWFLRKSSVAEKRQKVDLLIDDSGDLVFGSTNDLQLSYGMSNAIQALKLKMSVELGELKRHSDFGFAIIQGKTNIDTRGIKGILVASIERLIREDDRFDRIESLSVDYINGKNNEPNYFYIKMNVKIVGSDQAIPLTFSVNI